VGKKVVFELIIIELLLIALFLAIFYSTNIRGKTEKGLWLVIALLVSVSLFNINSCIVGPGPVPFKFCGGLITLFIDIGLVILDLTAILIIAVLVLKKFLEKRMRKIT